MSKTTYVLGAGFSSAAGAPLGNDLLPAIVAASRSGDPHPQRRRFLREVVQDLSNWFGSLEGLGFEQFLTIVSSETLFETLTGHPFSEARRRRPDMIWAALFVIKEGIGENRALHLYDQFARGLEPDDSIISLNYDVIVEDALIRNSNRFDAGIPALQVLDSLESFVSFSGTPVLKIHGSANLMRCASCRKWLVKGWKIAEDVLTPWDGRSRHLTCLECNGELLPVIVPPSLEKAGDLAEVKILWERALQELRSADQVTFIGCGIRPADFDLEALLQTSLGRRHAVPITVVCREAMSATRYLELFPNHSVTIIPGGFEHWVKDTNIRPSDTM